MEAVAHKTPALKQQRDRAKKRGFSLIEAAIVLGVVGAVIGTIWGASAKLHQERQLNQAVTDMLVIRENIRNLYKGFDLSSNTRFDTKAGFDAGIFKGSSIELIDENRASNAVNNIKADYVTGFSLRLDGYFIVFDLTTKTTEYCIKMGSFISSQLKNDASLYEIASGNLHRIFPFIPTPSECNAVSVYTAPPHSLHVFFRF